MTKFNINIDYKRPEAKNGEKYPTNQELTRQYLEYVTSVTFEKGLEGQKRRIFSRIMRKVDEAIDTKNDIVELETAEVDYIKALFRDDVKLIPQLARYLTVLEDVISELEKAPKI